MPRIVQKYIEPGSAFERGLADVRGRIVAKLGGPLQCEFQQLKRWLQTYVDPGGNLLGGCGVRADDLAPLLAAAGKRSGTVHSYFNSPLKPSPEEAWTSVGNALKRGQTIVIKGRGQEVSGEESNFANSTTWHAFVLLHVFEKEQSKPDEKTKPEWFIGFDPDCSATSETKALWTRLLQEAFESPNTEVRLLNERVGTLSPQKLHQIIKTMILGSTDTGFGPLVRMYAIDISRPLEPYT